MPRNREPWQNRTGALESIGKQSNMKSLRSPTSSREVPGAAIGELMRGDQGHSRCGWLQTVHMEGAGHK